jgi:predicted kinase
MEVIICKGIQGSGKSYFARKWVEKDPSHRIRINNDDIRNMLGPYWIPDREKLVSKIREDIISIAIKQQYNIIIDNMNLNKSAINEILYLFKDSNYTIKYEEFKTPLEICLERNSKRDNPIVKEVITKTYNKYKEFYK